MIGFSNPVSGMVAAVKRVDVAAANIANAQDTGPPEAAKVKPVGRAEASGPADDALFRPAEVTQTTTEDGGTRAELRPRDPAAELDYVPSDPNAGKDGTVARPNVDIASEFIDITMAQKAYEAAVKVMRVQDQMLGTTIDARS